MTDYRMGHSAPEDDGYSAQLPAVRDRFGPDILDQPDLYGTCDDETLRQMTVAVDDPDTMVRIYRAVPPSIWKSTAAIGLPCRALTLTITATSTIVLPGQWCSPTFLPARSGPMAMTRPSTATEALI